MDELTKILEKLTFSSADNAISGRIMDKKQWVKEITQARSAIMAWVEKEILPEANKDVPSSEPEEDSPEYNRTIGWNACLQEIKARLHKKGEKYGND